MLFNFSIQQLLLTTTTTFSSSSSQHFIPFFLNPQEGVGAIHTHECKCEWVRVCVYVCTCVTLFSLPISPPPPVLSVFPPLPDHISYESSYSAEEPYLVGLFPHKSPTFMAFSWEIQTWSWEGLSLRLPLVPSLSSSWCVRCLLITESPKTPSHYRY